MIPFVKAHGIGNDFILIPDLNDELEISAEAVRSLCHRRFGVGADAVIRVTRSEEAPFFMDYRNADGSLAEMCGNGVRAVGKWLGDRGLARESVDLDTRDGVKHLTLHRTDGFVDGVVADMGAPAFPEEVTETLQAGAETFDISFVSMGNPHAVLFVDDVDAVPLEVVGPLIQSQTQRFPEGVNVELAAVQSDGTIMERTFERGVGETLACGTAASAVAVAAQRRGLAGSEVEVQLRGGRLQLSWQPGSSVFMTGPAVEVFNGEFNESDFGIARK